MARVEEVAAKALRTMATNARVQNGHITPADWAEARERVAEYEAKGYKLDGMPQSSIYGIPPRKEEEQRKARERAALMAAIADYKAEKDAPAPQPEQKPAEAEQNREMRDALQRMQENQARLEALIAGLMAKKGEEDATGSDAKADDHREPESDAGKADDKAGADGVRKEAAGRDRERRNADRGSAKAFGRERKRGPHAKLSTEQMYEIYNRYTAGGITQDALAREYGVHINSIYSVITKIKYGMDVRGYENGYTRARKVVYPALEEWRRENGLSIGEMADAAGMSRGTLQTMMCGFQKAEGLLEYGPRMSTIDKLLALTGLKYEEAFRRDDGNKDLQRR